MGILSGLLGDSGGGLIKGVADAVDQFVETPDERAAQRLKEQALAMQPVLQQLAINEEQAKHKSVFVAGARPATMWVCTACMAAIACGGVYGWMTGIDLTPLYALYGTTIAPVHLGLLGLRSFDKVKGIATHSTGKPT